MLAPGGGSQALGLGGQFRLASLVPEGSQACGVDAPNLHCLLGGRLNPVDCAMQAAVARPKLVIRCYGCELLAGAIGYIGSIVAAGMCNCAPMCKVIQGHAACEVCPILAKMGLQALYMMLPNRFSSIVAPVRACRFGWATLVQQIVLVGWCDLNDATCWIAAVL